MVLQPDAQSIITCLHVEHWAIAGAGLFLLFCTLVLNCYFKTRRWRAVQDVRSGLVSAEFLSLRDIPKNAYDLVAEEALKERSTVVQPLWRDDCGWGRPCSEYAGVHFKRFIGMSLHILQAHAQNKYGSLQTCTMPLSSSSSSSSCSTLDYSKSMLACDVYDYLRRLRIMMDGELHDDLCNQYLAFYNNARIPGRECTEQEFRSFLGVFQEILRRIQR